MTSDLFDVMDGYTASYSVSVEGGSVSASASGAMVTINAEVAGESKVTVSGTARMPGASLMPSQTVSNDASLTFPVTVVDTTLVVTLSADPMEIEAAGLGYVAYEGGRECILEPSVSGSRFALLCRERHDEKSYSRRTFRRMLTRAGFQVTAETGILFVPWWRRMLDLACYTWARPLSRFTGLAVAPFQHLSLPSGTSQWPRRVGVSPARAAGESTARRHRTDRPRAASARDAHVGTVMARPGHPRRGRGRLP